MAVVTRWSMLLVLFLLARPGSLLAQQGELAPRRTVFSAGTFAGLGAGPQGATVWGIEGTAPIFRFVAIRAEYSRWGSGFGAACPSIWPDHYACTVGGWAGLAGIRAYAPTAERITPFLDVAGGRFVRKRDDADPHATAAISLGVGATYQLYRGLAARFGGSFFNPYDDDYKALMGEKLYYLTGTVGLEYRISR